MIKSTLGIFVSWVDFVDGGFPFNIVKNAFLHSKIFYFSMISRSDSAFVLNSMFPISAFIDSNSLKTFVSTYIKKYINKSIHYPSQYKIIHLSN